MNQPPGHTPAGAYRVAIDIENRFTPAEVNALPLFTGGLPRETRRQLWKTRRMMRRGHPRIRTYQRSETARNATLYRGAPTADRLLVVFCGIAGRPMIPTPVFLQFIPETRHDVLMLRDPTGNAYTHGVPGLGNDLQETLNQLAGQIDFTRYRETRALGVSSGGAAALCTGILLGSTLALSFGGRHPSCSRRARTGNRADRFDTLVAPLLAESGTWLANFRAENHPADEEGARSLRATLPACRDLVVTGTSNHILLAELAGQGGSWWRPHRNRLQTVFANFLLADTPASDTVTP